MILKRFPHFIWKLADIQIGSESECFESLIFVIIMGLL